MFRRVSSNRHTLDPRAILMIVLSGIAGAISWLFFYAALKLAPVWRVTPIDKMSVPLAVLLAVVVLGERPSLVNWIGVLLVTAGAYLTIRGS